MKRIFISDIHLHTWSYGATVASNGMNTRLLAQAKALNEVERYAIENNIDYIYHGGDMFHTPGSVPTQALYVFNNFVRELSLNKINFRGIVGNHDQATKDGYINSVFPYATQQIENWYDRDLPVSMMGYTQDEDAIKQLLSLAADEGGLILMHQGVKNVPLASGYVVDECLTPAMIPANCMAFTGHYHFHKRVTSNLTVIGNLTALNWNDIDQEKGFLVWDDETNEIEFISSKAPRFISFSEGQELGLVENCFVRYTDEIKVTHIAEIRETLINNGAITVEFPNKSAAVSSAISMAKIESNRRIFQPREYLSVIEPKLEPRRKQVGEELRNGTYETA